MIKSIPKTHKNIYFTFGLKNFDDTCVMKEPIKSVSVTMRRVNELKGMNIRLKVNRGRNKFIEYVGTITDAYPSIFTFQTSEGLESFSYSDVVTGNILFYRLKD